MEAFASNLQAAILRWIVRTDGAGMFTLACKSVIRLLYGHNYSLGKIFPKPS